MNEPVKLDVAIPDSTNSASVSHFRSETVREIQELCRTYPAPDPKEVSIDVKWLLDRINTPELEPYRGKYVAVAFQRILATGDDPLELNLWVAKEQKVHPHRFFIDFLDEYIEQ